VSYRGLQ